MKKILMTLIATAMVMGATAQSDSECKCKKDGKCPDRKEMVEKRKEIIARRTQEIAKKYNLSAEQTEKLTALNEKYAPKGGHFGRHHGHRHHGMKPGERPELSKAQDCAKPEIKGEGAPQGSRADHKKAMKERREQYDKELQSILTPEQYKAFKADIKAKKKEHKKHKKDGKKGCHKHDGCPDKK